MDILMLGIGQDTPQKFSKYADFDGLYLPPKSTTKNISGKQHLHSFPALWPPRHRRVHPGGDYIRAAETLQMLFPAKLMVDQGQPSCLTMKLCKW